MLAYVINSFYICRAQHKNQGMQVVNLHTYVQVIFMTSLKIFGVIVPPCEVLMYSQHSLNVLSNGTGNDTFLYIIVMLNNSRNQIFQYNGSPISFQKGDSIMVNATEMAKPFGKLVGDWLRLKSTSEFTKALSTDMQIPISALIQAIKGGNGDQGTWMHEDVALEFARWLSPAFAIWCNKRIKELLTTGVTTVSNDDEAIAYAMSVLQKRLEQAKEEKARLEAESAAKDETIELQQEEIKKAAPKVNYYDTTLQSVNTQTTTQVAKSIGMDAQRLNKHLKEAGIIFYQSGQWMLKQPYASWHLHATRTQTYTRSDGSTGTSTYTVWTEKGKRFIHALHECEWKVKEAIKHIKGEQAA